MLKINYATKNLLFSERKRGEKHILHFVQDDTSGYCDTASLGRGCG